MANPEIRGSLDLKNLRVQQLPSSSGPTSSDQQRTISKLASELSAKVGEVSRLTTETGRLKIELSGARRDLRSKEELLVKRDREIASLRQQAGKTAEMPSDEKGYYRMLGLHPSFAQGLTPTEARKVLRSAYRTYSTIFHPDSGGNQDRMKKINAAHDELVKIHGS